MEFKVKCRNDQSLCTKFWTWRGCPQNYVLVLTIIVIIILYPCSHQQSPPCKGTNSCKITTCHPQQKLFLYHPGNPLNSSVTAINNLTEREKHCLTCPKSNPGWAAWNSNEAVATLESIGTQCTPLLKKWETWGELVRRANEEFTLLFLHY